MKKYKRIAIVCANLKGNIGDFAILQAMINKLAHLYPGHKVDVFSHGHLTIDKEAYSRFQENAGDLFNYRGVIPWIDVPRRSRIICRLRLWPYVQKVLIDRASRMLKREIYGREFEQYRGVFIAGGEQWGGSNLGVNMFALLKCLKSLNCNVHTFPFSIPSSITNFNRKTDLIKYFRCLFGPAIARDRTTCAILQSIGVDCISAVDMVFSLAPPKTKVAQEKPATRVAFAVTGCHSAKLDAYIDALRCIKKSNIEPQ